MKLQKINFLDSKKEMISVTSSIDCDRTPAFKRMFYDSRVVIVISDSF